MERSRSSRSARLIGAALPALCLSAAALAREEAPLQGAFLPTGVRITPQAAAGSHFQPLNPGLAEFPAFTADHAVASRLSPDGRTLLVLTSGYNLNNGADGNVVPAASNEYVFVFDVSRFPPVQTQVLQIPNSFVGLAWARDGKRFYVSGGQDDLLHVFAAGSAGYAEVTPALPLGPHAGDRLLRGLLQLGPVAAGLDVTADGRLAVVAGFENDVATVVDLASGARRDVDLRPAPGVAGGEFPLGVAVRGSDTAYVTSERDAEVVVIDLVVSPPQVKGRIPVGQQPSQLLLDRAQRRLFVTNSNSDSVSIIDTGSGKVVEEIHVTGPQGLLGHAARLRGANPNNLALSPDQRTLFVTNAGTNSVAVVRLGEQDGDGDDDGDERSEVIGLIPTGWYPSAVAVTSSHLFVLNAKGVAGANPKACQPNAKEFETCNAANQYVWQLEKAGLLSLPLPAPRELYRLTRQVAVNNRFPGTQDEEESRETMEFLRSRIKHVVYVIKENRTYDQILGDLDRGNGDPTLTAFPEATTPNFHELARRFVTLDNFYDSGESSGVGWNWTTSGRTTDVVEKTQPVNYAGRGFSYDWEGTNRNINVGIESLDARRAAQPLYDVLGPAFPDFKDQLPGARDVSAAQDDSGATAYLWANALRQGLTVRNYGCFGDLSRYQLPGPLAVLDLPLDREPFAHQSLQFIPASPALQQHTDPYFRGFDQRLPDYWRFKEWEREFDLAVKAGELASLTLLRLPHDHFGSFGAALDGVNTPDLQIADNDYAVGLVVEKISRSPFAKDTLIFVIEDDSQDGPDHVDAHRSVALVLGPYVKRGAVVSHRYTTVSMVRTIEDLLGLPHQGLTDGLAAPMARVFQREAHDWSFSARPSALLRNTQLPLPAPSAEEKAAPALLPSHDAAFWEKATAGERFDREDAVDSARFNRVLWQGLMGERPYPVTRHGRDLSSQRPRAQQPEQVR